MIVWQQHSRPNLSIAEANYRFEYFELDNEKRHQLETMRNDGKLVPDALFGKFAFRGVWPGNTPQSFLWFRELQIYMEGLAGDKWIPANMDTLAYNGNNLSGARDWLGLTGSNLSGNKTQVFVIDWALLSYSKEFSLDKSHILELPHGEKSARLIKIVAPKSKVTKYLYSGYHTSLLCAVLCAVLNKAQVISVSAESVNAIPCSECFEKVFSYAAQYAALFFAFGNSGESQYLNEYVYSVGTENLFKDDADCWGQCD